MGREEEESVAWTDALSLDVTDGDDALHIIMALVIATCAVVLEDSTISVDFLLGNQ
jgi:hypothetical protein